MVEAVRFYNENNLSKTEVAKKYNTDRHMMLKVERFGLEKLKYSDYLKKYYCFTDKELEAINLYLNDNTCSFGEITRRYRFKSTTFKRLLRVIGEDDTRRYQCNFNRDALKEIVTEEDAYILGFILADGYVNEERKFLRIKINARDEDLLVKILKYMQSDQDIHYEYHTITGNKQAYITFNCKELVDTLVGYGIRQAKSCKEEPIEEIPLHLKKHFIRGIVDGDGYISQDLLKTGLSGSQAICEYICYYYNSLGTPLQKKPREDFQLKSNQEISLWRLEYSGESARIIIKDLYENATIYLNRKYELARQVMAMDKSDKNGESFTSANTVLIAGNNTPTIV